ncbi:MAG: oligosaccharide flippase family protein [Candidatus Borkfalkiaceae bacterium]|nr:oligosaccharide flippase family protein [Christensenellaceae bacterium]
MAKRNNVILRNALLVASSGLIVKLLGALYRIPLNNVLKAEGLGIYQTAFPTYLILMTFCGTAATSAITKIISSGENAEAVLKISLRLIVPAGVLGWGVMTFFSEKLSAMQGNSGARLSYIALAPSLVFVSVISCLRGYFQGGNDMKPTASSQIAEQIVKIAAGLSLCFLFGSTPAEGAFFACLAVSVSEFIAMIYLISVYKTTGIRRAKLCRLNQKFTINRLIGLLLPTALISIILPMTKFFDSFVVLNVLNKYAKNATDLYGLYSGSVESVIGMPVAVCYGIAASVLPGVSHAEAEKDYAASDTFVLQAITYTLFLSALAFAFLALFPGAVVKVLFPRLSAENKIVLKKLISYAAVNVVFLSLIQTQTSILVAKNKPYSPAICLFVGFAVKATTEIPLLKNPDLNVFGTLYSDILCYFVAVLLNMVYIITINSKRKKANEDLSCGGGRTAGRLVAQSLGTCEKNR